MEHLFKYGRSSLSIVRVLIQSPHQKRSCRDHRKLCCKHRRIILAQCLRFSLILELLFSPRSFEECQKIKNLVRWEKEKLWNDRSFAIYTISICQKLYCTPMLANVLLYIGTGGPLVVRFPVVRFPLVLFFDSMKQK